jgi:hypothetical protein
MPRTHEHVLRSARGVFRSSSDGALEFERLRDAAAYASALYHLRRLGQLSLIDGSDEPYLRWESATARTLFRRGIIIPLPDLWFRVRPLRLTPN